MNARDIIEALEYLILHCRSLMIGISIWLVLFFVDWFLTRKKSQIDKEMIEVLKEQNVLLEEQNKILTNEVKFFQKNITFKVRNIEKEDANND